MVPKFFATFPHPAIGQAYELEGWLEVLEGPGSSSGAVKDGGGEMSLRWLICRRVV